MNEKFQVVAVGDTTQDIFLGMSDASVQCDLDGDNCKISFDYADKIAVDKKTDVPAVGNAANHAIGVARLGLHTSVYTVIGDDTQGHIAEEVFKENKVDTSNLAFDKEHGTNFSCVINYRGERTILVYHEPRKYALPSEMKSEWVYLTSASGQGVDELHQQMQAWLGVNKESKLAFNPGTHQMHLGREKLEPLLAWSDILFLNREEAAEVLGIKEKDVLKLVKQYHELGVKIMVLTDGPDGVYVSDQKQVLFLPIFEGPVVERTGAGDAYGSGFLSALIKGKSLSEAMLWGNSNSTSVLQHIGAREGLLNEEGIVEMIKNNADIKPKEYTG